MNAAEMLRLIVTVFVLEVIKSTNAAYVVVLVRSMSVDVKNYRQMI